MSAREIGRPSVGQWAAQDLPQADTNGVRSNLPYSRGRSCRHQTEPGCFRESGACSTNWKVQKGFNGWSCPPSGGNVSHMTLATPEADGEATLRSCERPITMPPTSHSPQILVATPSTPSHVGMTRRRRVGRWILPVLGLAALFGVAAMFLAREEGAPP